MTDPNRRHLAFVVDRSSSMTPIAANMNTAIKTVLDEQNEADGELHVDVWSFDDTVEHLYTDVRADEVKGELVRPRGNTALNDAIAIAVRELGERFAEQHEDDRPGKVIFVIVTDGMENASKEFPGAEGREAVKAMIETQKTQFNWEVLFFGADSIDAFATAAGYGIQRGETISFSRSSKGVAGAAVAASGYMTRSFAGEATAFSDDERDAAEGKTA